MRLCENVEFREKNHKKTTGTLGDLKINKMQLLSLVNIPLFNTISSNVSWLSLIS